MTSFTAPDRWPAAYYWPPWTWAPGSWPWSGIVSGISALPSKPSCSRPQTVASRAPARS